MGARRQKTSISFKLNIIPSFFNIGGARTAKRKEHNADKVDIEHNIIRGTLTLFFKMLLYFAAAAQPRAVHRRIDPRAMASVASRPENLTISSLKRSAWKNWEYTP
jgi:hypothetical protein